MRFNERHKFWLPAVRLSRKQFPKDHVVANLVAGNNGWIGDVVNAESNQIYLDWRSRNDALEYRIKDQMRLLHDDFNSNFELIDDKLPHLLVLMGHGQLWPETLVVLDKLLNFSKQWNKKLDKNLVWTQWGMFIRKYSPFVKFDAENIRTRILERFSDN